MHGAETTTTTGDRVRTAHASGSDAAAAARELLDELGGVDAAALQF